jgi:hypothetical protein
MKRIVTFFSVLCFAVPAIAQNDTVRRETTTVTTTTTTTATVTDTSYDLLGLETFNFLDATTLQDGTVDLRIAGRWVDSPDNRKQVYTITTEDDDEDDQGDQIILIPEIVWGATDRLELWVSVPFWVDGEPEEGNYDTNVGGQWRISDLDENCPAWALASQIRVPTGDGSNGIDWELRLILTNEYESGLRSHLNIFGITVNTDNYADPRDFQYGAVAGLDGPLNDSGSLRWVFDYFYRSSYSEGSEPDLLYYPSVDPDTGGEKRNTAELGLQWQINECNKLGFAVQAGLDHAENETPEWAGSLTYAYTIGAR